MVKRFHSRALRSKLLRSGQMAWPPFVLEQVANLFGQLKTMTNNGVAFDEYFPSVTFL